MLSRTALALAGLFLPAAALAQDPPPDPLCPLGDMAFARPAGSECIGRLTSGYAFALVYGAEIRAIPPLEALLREEARRGEAWIADRAREWARERRKAGGDVFPLSYEALWSAEASPELAAASGSIAHYTGGAHGGIEFKTILLDRTRGRPIALADLFTDPARAMALVQQGFCAKLREEMGERRGTDESGMECPTAAEQPITLNLGASARFDSFYALLNPYVAGSWAEGPYDFAFPVTAELLALIKSEYRSAFAVGASN
ncbi:MAG TPA: hypothetical protein VEW04_01595 [Allosphingosinicella sp.]|nr:hypothetical protein [Allosphingosinicella sp.]